MLNVFVKFLRFDVLCEKKFFFGFYRKKFQDFILLFYSKKKTVTVKKHGTKKRYSDEMKITSS